MFNEIMSLALGNGLWAALFCLLFLYQLKDSRAREKKYAGTIDSLTKSLSGVREIKRDCTEIAEAVARIKYECESIKADTELIKSDSAAIKSDSLKIKANTELIKADSAIIKKDSTVIKSRIFNGNSAVNAKSKPLSAGVKGEQSTKSFSRKKAVCGELQSESNLEKKGSSRWIANG